MDISDIYRNDDDGVSPTAEQYREGSRRKRLAIVAVCLFTVFVTLSALILCNLDLGVRSVLNALIHPMGTDTLVGRVVWLVDLPMMVIAIVAGASLSVSGAAMQCILRNPLASPYTLGISSAAAFGAAFSIVVLDGGTASSSGIFLSSPYVTMLCAFVFALASLGAILVLTKLTNVSAETIVLAGIAVSAIFGAGLTLMQYFADTSQLSAIVSWTFGNINHTEWFWNLVFLLILVVVSLFFYINRWNMNAMDAGDEVAKGLGVNTERFRIIGLVVATFIAAAVVSKFGVIAFIGLIGPHIARMIVGSDHRHLIPMSLVTGACILLIAACVASNILRPMVLPVGLLTSLLGGPAFIYLLIRRYRR